jgi:DNA adenine methylase
MSRYSTPLRYPGGKQRLAPFIREVLEENDAVGWTYAEPYAGGAGIAIELLLENKVSHVYLNDSSLPIYSFWKALLDDPDQFCRQVSLASLTLEAWRQHREILRHPQEHDAFELGFSTFYLNRCSRSGILTAGVIGGLAQTGKWRIDARFPRNELIKRVENIAKLSSRITVSNSDAETFMTGVANGLPPETLIYCDPPYYARAKRLYLDTYENEDHARIARVVQEKLHRPWLVSYDNNATIAELYSSRRSFCYSLQYSAVTVYEGSELFIFSDDLAIPAVSSLPHIHVEVARIHPARRRRRFAKEHREASSASGRFTGTRKLARQRSS